MPKKSKDTKKTSKAKKTKAVSWAGKPMKTPKKRVEK